MSAAAGAVPPGDIGRLGEEGFLTGADRLKDMIVVVGGGHAYTTEREDLLNSHPKVLQSAAFGVRDADRMEQAYAVVVTEQLTVPGIAVQAAESLAEVRETARPHVLNRPGSTSWTHCRSRTRESRVRRVAGISSAVKKIEAKQLSGPGAGVGAGILKIKGFTSALTERETWSV
ncbi:hypothetical protein [Streptomyces sp. NRRL WC-3549]|uniref:hypothetical protein n=1 Tax=Streptomyces sp. NRRL WC-3549 TaxID=1463925 RepID=UPI0004C58722